MANFANVARERQPQNLERREVRRSINFIPVLGKNSYVWVTVSSRCHAACSRNDGRAQSCVRGLCCLFKLVILVAPTSWFQQEPEHFGFKLLRPDWKRVGNRNLAGFCLMTIQKKVTWAFFEKKCFFAEEGIILRSTFQRFWRFRPFWTKIVAEKIRKPKKSRLRFFHVVMKNIPAKFHFPTLVESGRKSDFRESK